MSEPNLAQRRRPSLIAAKSAALRRVAIAGPSGSSMVRLRGEMIAAIKARRHTVMCIAPVIEEADGRALDALGVERQTFAAAPGGLGLFTQRRTVLALTTALAGFRPHVVLAYGGETALMAVKAAHWGKVERIVALINEVPGDERDGRSLRGIGRTLELTDAAVFHNSDDPKWLKAQGLLPRDLSYVVVPGAGVDLAHYGVQPLPALDGGLVFLMIARMERAKGVIDYCEAARALKARAPTARFRLAGPPGSGAGAVSAQTLASYSDCVELLGPLADVRPALGECHVYVYPSHMEGMPRSVLEALASGRPVITTDGPGCRETADVRVNGCLVAKGDVPALAVAMESFLKRPDLIPAMARASRAKAERRFDVLVVNERLLEVMGLG